jgi:hypothetical protein
LFSLPNSSGELKATLQCTAKAAFTKGSKNFEESEKKGDIPCLDKSIVMDVMSLEKVVYEEELPDELLRLSKELLGMEESEGFNVETNYIGQVLQKDTLRKLTAKTNLKDMAFNLVCSGKLMVSMHMVDEVKNGEFQVTVDDAQSRLIDRYCKSNLE